MRKYSNFLTINYQTKPYNTKIGKYIEGKTFIANLQNRIFMKIK